MGANSDFWLVVHHLAEAIRQEGTSPQSRLESISESFDALPAVTQREMSQEFGFVITELNSLKPVMAAKPNLGDRIGKPKKR